MADHVNERFNLVGQSVIITGGGKGIGKVYAEAFAQCGARVVAADIDAPAAGAVAGPPRTAATPRSRHNAISPIRIPSLLWSAPRSTRSARSTSSSTTPR